MTKIIFAYNVRSNSAMASTKASTPLSGIAL
jgi:hypothetical protein